MKDKVLVFGTGSVAYELYSILNKDKIEILAFVNSDGSVHDFFGYSVILPQKIHCYEYDYVVIASGYVESIQALLIQQGVEKRKIVSYIYDESETYKEIGDAISVYMNEKYNRGKMEQWIIDEKRIPSIYPAVFWKSDFSLSELNKDFVREQQLKLLAQQLQNQNIDGAIAECGVFRGDFTVVINQLFSGKKLYLYDSFEGFSQEDIFNDDTIENKTGEVAKFKNTSEKFVLNRLTGSDNTVIIKKGFFPKSFNEGKEKFSFVSVDFNLYDPVFSALDIFYERMLKGGYILVSDYNAPFYDGTKKAVDDWCRKSGKNIIPIPDFYGSALIVKE